MKTEERENKNKIIVKRIKLRKDYKLIVYMFFFLIGWAQIYNDHEEDFSCTFG